MTDKKKLKFKFSMSTRIIFGEGAAEHAQRYLKSLGVKRALVVTDGGLKDSELLDGVVRNMRDVCGGVFDEVVPDSGLEIITRGAERGREWKVDGILSVGGGSSMDTAKCIAVLLKKNRGDISEFLGFRKVGEPVVPHVAIPTTAGTGSEVVSFAMVRGEKEKVKHVIGDFNLIPQIAILDPRLTLSLPKEITAATGADALSHAIESLYAVLSEPISDGLALQAVSLIVDHLPQCVKDGSNIEARGMQLIASCMAGMAFQNAHVGVVHALAHAVGGMFGVTHGVANGIFLPYGLEFNAETCAHRYRMLAPIFGINPEGEKTSKITTYLIQSLREFLLDLGIPQRLSEVGVKEDQLKACAELALSDPVMAGNPRKINTSEPLLQILQSAF